VCWFCCEGGCACDMSVGFFFVVVYLWALLRFLFVLIVCPASVSCVACVLAGSLMFKGCFVVGGVALCVCVCVWSVTVGYFWLSVVDFR